MDHRRGVGRNDGLLIGLPGQESAQPQSPRFVAANDQPPKLRLDGLAHGRRLKHRRDLAGREGARETLGHDDDDDGADEVAAVGGGLIDADAKGRGREHQPYADGCR